MSGQAVILFDGVCNLCNCTVDFLLRRDRKGVFQFAALQSEAARRLVPSFKIQTEGLDSIILIEDKGVYMKSAAALRIARKMSGLWPLLYLFIIIPRPLRDAVYDWVAHNRYRWFGKREACTVPTPELMDRFLK